MEFNNNTVQNIQPQGQVPPVQPVPQPNPMQQSPGQVQMSQMERLRQQMMQQNGQPQQANPTMMQQGSSYNPVGQQGIPPQQPLQQQQPAQQMNMQQPQHQPQQQAIPTPPQNSQQDNGDSSSDKEKPKMSPKFILIGFGLFVAVIIIMFVLSQLNKADNPNPDPSSSGAVDEFGNPVGDGTGDDLIFIEPNDDIVGYEFDQIENLRAAGYTGTEIEENEANGVPYEDLIKQAEDARQAWIDEAIAPLYDTASDEYKSSVRNTWLGLPNRTDVEDFQQVGSYYEETKNFDYEKVEPRGYQLFVKIYLDDTNHDNYFFLSVEPSEYLKLKDSGNVVVTYKYTVPVVWSDEQQAFVENMDQIFITDASLTIFD